MILACGMYMGMAQERDIYSQDSLNHIQAIANDSVHQSISRKPWLKTDSGKSILASAAFIGLGLYSYKDSGFMNRRDIKDAINRYLPNYENNIDDYTQYLPYVATFALDGFGVKSKHTTKRKISTTATALGLNLIVVQGLKYTIEEPRPDNSANNSFPSGHTTTAFMGAHIFHKEYGDRSPYYSIAAYTLASITGLFRQLNDRHWSSDVLVGAGLGISLTELAYAINQSIYKDREINEIIIKDKTYNKEKPSFLGIKVGYTGLLESFNNPDLDITAQNGFNAEIEGAYFFNRYIGVGGVIGMQSFPIRIGPQGQLFEEQGFELVFQPIGAAKYQLGPYLQTAVGQKGQLGIKFLAGFNTFSDTEVSLRDRDISEITEEDYIVYADFRPDNNFSFTTGIYYNRLISSTLALGLYADFNYSELNYDYVFLESFDDLTPVYSGTLRDRTPFESMSFGANLYVMLW